MDALADLPRAVLYDEEVSTAVPHDDPKRPLYLYNTAENLVRNTSVLVILPTYGR